MPTTEFNLSNTPTWEARETAEYKLMTRGTMAVSDLELLITIVGKRATAKRLLTTFKSLRNLANATLQELMQVSGVSRKSALVLVSTFELARRQQVDERSMIRFSTSQDVAAYLIAKYAHYNREVFVVLFLNRANNIIAEEKMFLGGLSNVAVDPRFIFKKAISHLSAGIILAHNHPSGNLQPSRADIDITRKTVGAGQLLDIVVLDHIIFSHTGYYSFADDGKV